MSTLLAASIPLDPDGTLSANSDSKVATQKATKTYADTKGVVDGQQIYDGSHVLAADFGARQLKSVSGVAMLDWSNSSSLSFMDGASAFDDSGNFIGGWLGVGIDNSSNPSIRSADRQLIANDGSTVALDWSTPSASINMPTLPIGDPSIAGAVYIFTGAITDLTNYLAGGGELLAISQG